MVRRGGLENGGTASGYWAAQVMADAIEELYANILRQTGNVNRERRLPLEQFLTSNKSGEGWA